MNIIPNIKSISPTGKKVNIQSLNPLYIYNVDERIKKAVKNRLICSEKGTCLYIEHGNSKSEIKTECFGLFVGLRLFTNGMQPISVSKLLVMLTLTIGLTATLKIGLEKTKKVS